MKFNARFPVHRKTFLCAGGNPGDFNVKSTDVDVSHRISGFDPKEWVGFILRSDTDVCLEALQSISMDDNSLIQFCDNFSFWFRLLDQRRASAGNADGEWGDDYVTSIDNIIHLEHKESLNDTMRSQIESFSDFIGAIIRQRYQLLIDLVIISLKQDYNHILDFIDKCNILNDVFGRFRLSLQATEGVGPTDSMPSSNELSGNEQNTEQSPGSSEHDNQETNSIPVYDGDNIVSVATILSDDDSFDSFFACVKKTVTHILDSGIFLGDFYVSPVFNNVYDKAWVSSQRINFSFELSNDQKKAYYLLRYWSSSDTAEMRAIMNESIVTFRQVNDEIPTNILQLISDVYNLVFMIAGMQGTRNDVKNMSAVEVHGKKLIIQRKIEPTKLKILNESDEESSKRSTLLPLEVILTWDEKTKRYTTAVSKVFDSIFKFSKSQSDLQRNMMALLIKSNGIPSETHMRYNSDRSDTRTFEKIIFKVPNSDFSWIVTAGVLALNNSWQVFKNNILCMKVEIQFHLASAAVGIEDDTETVLAIKNLVISLVRDFMSEIKLTDLNVSFSTLPSERNPAVVNIAPPESSDGRFKVNIGILKKEVRVFFNARDKHVAIAIQNGLTKDLTNSKNSSKKLKSLELVSVSFNDGFITSVDIEKVDRLEEIRRRIVPVLDQYDFYSIDALDDLDSSGNGTMEGFLDNNGTFQEYFKALKRYAFPESSVFDYVHLVRDGRNILLNLFPEIHDWTFELLHIRKNTDEFDNIHEDFSNFMECVWISIVSFATQPHLIGGKMMSASQRFAVTHLYSRFTTFIDMCSFVCKTCQSKRWADDAKAKEIPHFMNPDKAVVKKLDFSDVHKKIIATILNLNIHELSYRDDMKLSNDFSSVIVNYTNSHQPQDTFYLNSAVYPTPTIQTPPVYFKIRQNFVLRSVGQGIVKAVSHRFPDLDDVQWKCDQPRSFFDCISSSFKSDRDNFIYHSARNAMDDFIRILNLIYSWYVKGLRMKQGFDRNPNASNTHKGIFKIGVLFLKIRLFVKSIISHHWNEMTSSAFMDSNGQTTADLENIDVKTWDIFLSLVRTENYMPSPFEIQLLADYFKINICVFGISTYGVYFAYETAVDGKDLEWIFTTSMQSSHQWCLAYGGSTGNFQVMYPINALSEHYARQFIVKPNLNAIKLLQRFTPNDRISGCDVVVNLPHRFYDALDEFFKMRNILRHVDMFTYKEYLDTSDWDKCVDILHKDLADVIDDMESKHGFQTFTRELHVALDEILQDAKKSIRERKMYILSSLATIAENFLSRCAIIAGQHSVSSEVIDFIRSKRPSSFPVSQSSVQIMQIIYESDISPIVKPGLELKHKEFPGGTAEIIKDFLYKCSDTVKTSILRDQYFGEGWANNPDDKKRQIDERYRAYALNGGFRDHIPSVAEFKQLAHALKLRIIIFTSDWFKQDVSSFERMGLITEFGDFGPDFTEALGVVLEGANFSFIEFNTPLNQRSPIHKMFASASNWTQLYYKAIGDKASVTAVSNGTFQTPPVNPVLYTIIAVSWNESLDQLMRRGRRHYKAGWIMYHVDKRNEESFNTSKNKIGEFGPQTYDEFEELVRTFEAADCPVRIIGMINVAWNILIDPVKRYVYHVHGLFPPGEECQGLADINPVFPDSNTQLEFHNSNSMVDSDSEDIDWSTLTRVEPINVSVLIKKSTGVLGHGLKTVYEDHFQFSNAITTRARTSAVKALDVRFNPTSNSDFCKYAAMIPIRKSSSSVTLKRTQYKVFVFPGPNAGAYDFTKISIFSFAPSSDFPDFQTGLPRSVSGILDNTWKSEWCGLKRCIQGSFYYAKHSPTFINLLTKISGLTHIDWVSQYYANANDVWSPDDDTGVCFVGVTNPHHVTLSNVKRLVGLAVERYNSHGRNKGESVTFYKEIKGVVDWLCKSGGLWESEESVKANFASFSRDRSALKKNQSFHFMRILSMIYNVNFIVVEPAPSVDINSMCVSKNTFYFYDKGNKTNHTYVYDLKNTWVKMGSVVWPDSRQDKKSFLRSDNALKATWLPVYITWRNERWELLRWDGFVNTAEEEEAWKKKYEDMRRNNAQERRNRNPGKKKPSNPAPSGPAGPDNSSGGGAGSAGNGGRGGRYSSSHSNDDFCNEGDGNDGNDHPEIDNGDDDYVDSIDYYDDGSNNEGNGYWIPYGGYDHSSDTYESDSVLDRYKRAEFDRNKNFQERKLASRLGFKFPKNRNTSRKDSHRSIFFNEDDKEIHFLTQKLPMALSELVYLKPFGCCNLKIQIAQTEQSKMLAVLFASCFQDSKVVPIKGCFTSRVVVACKGLRKEIVYCSGIIPALMKCFNMNECNFRNAIQKIRDSGLIPKARIDSLEKQAQMASDEVWADDFRCSLVLARSYIQAALEGKVSPAPEYLSPELADLMNKRVFSRVTEQQRSQNLEMIRTLMKSDIGNQLLPLFRVVFHPDLHTWRMTLPERKKRERESESSENLKPTEYWHWDAPAAAATQFSLRLHLP